MIKQNKNKIIKKSGAIGGINNSNVGNTSAEITWCPGCSNFMILQAVKNAMNSLITSGHNKKDFVVVSGIGCHGKISDYVDVSSLTSLHGRSIPTATGIKIANPKLDVIAHVGDGDTYNEGISHFIHAAKRNSNITVIVHNNMSFSLTKGQPTATSKDGLPTEKILPGPKSQEQSLNPIALALSSGASFVARAFAGNLQQLSELITKAVKHKGFSFIDVLQPCVVYSNLMVLKPYIYNLQKSNHDITSFGKAMIKAYEAELSGWKKLPTGIFYQVVRPIFENYF